MSAIATAALLACAAGAAIGADPGAATGAATGAADAPRIGLLAGPEQQFLTADQRSGAIVVYNAGDVAEAITVSASEWLTPDAVSFTLAPGATRQVGFAVAIPEHATPGDHRVAVEVTAMQADPSPAAQSGQSVRSRISSSVSVVIRVGGPLVAAATAETGIPWLVTTTSGDVAFTPVIRNTGNVVTVWRAASAADASVSVPTLRLTSSWPRLADDAVLFRGLDEGAGSALPAAITVLPGESLRQALVLHDAPLLGSYDYAYTLPGTGADGLAAVSQAGHVLVLNLRKLAMVVLLPLAGLLTLLLAWRLTRVRNPRRHRRSGSQTSERLHIPGALRDGERGLIAIRPTTGLRSRPTVRRAPPIRLLPRLRTAVIVLELVAMAGLVLGPGPALVAVGADPTPAATDQAPAATDQAPAATDPAVAPTPGTSGTVAPEATPEPAPTPTPEATPAPEPTPDPTGTPAPDGAVALSVSLIVRFLPGATPAQRDAAVAAAGGTVTGSLAALGMVAIDVPATDTAAAIAAYRANPAVASAELDRVRSAGGAPSDPAYSTQWNLPLIGWDAARASVSPADHAKLAVLDTGIDAAHADLAGQVTGGWSAFGTDPLTDPNGHGTAVAGIAAATTDNATGVAGVAWTGTTLLSVQVLGADGTGTDSDIIAGILWAADHGADVILMAFSSPGYSAALQAAVDYAWSRGAVLVAATGNDGATTPTYPAGDAHVMGVSATNSSDALAAGSNSGTDTFIAAPGVGIPTLAAGGGTYSMTGTSAAAAQIAGAAALLRALDPLASAAVVIGRLARTADRAGSAADTGNGRLNLGRAVTDTGTAPIDPVGAPGGGPFAGPYVVAAACVSTGSTAWNVVSTWTGCGGLIPGASDGVTIANGHAVTIPAGYAAAASSVTITGTNANTSLTLSASDSSLAVVGAVTINRPTSNTRTVALNVNAGTATVGGTLTMAGTSTTASRIAQVTLTTGTLSITGGLTLGTGIAGGFVLNLGSGTVNLAGAFTATLGTITAGGTSTFNYNGSAAQTVRIGVSSLLYANLTLNNAAGATLSAAMSATNVTGNVTVARGILSNGGFAMAGNAAKTISVANGATLRLAGTTSAMPTGFGTTTLGATSTVDFAGTGNQTIAVANYGNLTISAGGTKTPGATLFVAGNFSQTAGTFVGSTGAAQATTIAGNFSLTGGTFNLSSSGSTSPFAVVSVAGDFNASAGTLTESGATTGSGFVFTKTGVQTYTSGATVTNVVNFTVNSGSTLQMATAATTVSGGGTFTLSSGATLGITAATGITTVGTSSGNIQTTLGRSYSAAANYTYNGAGTQSTGTGLPTNLTGILTIDDAGFTVTLDNARTIASTGSVVLKAGVFAAGTNLTMATTSSISRSEGSMTGTPQGAGVYNVTYTGLSKTTTTELAGAGLNSVTVTLTAGQTLTLDQSRAPDGDLTVSTGTVDLASFTMDRSASGGTITIASGAALRIGGTNGFPANYTTRTLGATSTVEYAGTTQSVLGGASPAYGNLTVSGSGVKTATANLAVAGDLTVSAGTLDLGAFTANRGTSGGTITVASGAALRIGGTSTAFPTNYTTRTLGATSTVEYYGTTQTVLALAYGNLTINQASGNATLGASASVAGVLTLTAGNLAVTDPYILDMGAAATTVGATDVTGIVRRTTIDALTSYTFGSAFSAITWAVAATLPTSFSMKTTIGAAPGWKTNAILREYNFLATWPGGIPNDSSTMTVNLHYHDAELNGKAEASLVFFDCHTATAPCTSSDPIEEHGRTNIDTTNNWVGRSALPTTYFGVATWGTRPWTLGATNTVYNTWQGSVSSSWTNLSNWAGGHVPTSTENVAIPDAATTANDPTLPATSVVINTMTLYAGAVLNGSSLAPLTLNGSTGAWVNEGGTFNPSTSTVTFAGAAATLSGTNNFYSLTVGSGATLLVGTDSVTRIAGAFTNSGTFDVDELPNTIEYNGAAQTVIAPNGATPGYWHLVLSGSGVKTMPASAIDVDGNFTLAGTASTTAASAIDVAGNLTIGSGTSFTSGALTHLLGGHFTNNGGTFIATGSTWTLDGLTPQSLSGSSTFDNLTVNNSTGVTLASSQTISGTLTLTSGILGVGANTLTLGGPTAASLGSLTSAASGTVHYSGAGAQTVVAAAYGNLTSSSSGARTLANAGTIGVAGIFTPGSNAYTTSGSTISFNGSTQNIPAFGFNNLTVSGSGVKTATGTLAIAGDLAVSAGTLDLGAYTADRGTSGGTFTVASGTTLRIGGTGTTFPSGYTTRTLGSTSTVEYYGTTQAVLAQTYANLTINQASGNASLAADAAVNGILTLTAGNLVVAHEKILDMGAAATTVGATDVTGIVRRTTIVADTSYTFGNQYTTIVVAPTGTLPTVLSVEIVLGSAPAWKTGAILRTYEIVQTGGDSSSRVALNLHYLDAELNGNDEANLALFDYHATVPRVDEHGRTSSNATDNWVGWAGIRTTYLPAAGDAKLWTLGTRTATFNTWLGVDTTDWSATTNWSHGHVPDTGDDVEIPVATTTDYDPTLPASLEIKTLTMRAGSVLNGAAGAALTLNGSAGAWVNEGGTFNPDTSTVTFTGAAATMSGTNDFYNLTVDSGKALALGTNSVTRIGGALTNGGTLDAHLVNTIEYNGGDQTVIAPNGSPAGYWHLVLSGSGAKTMPAAALAIAGNFTLAGTATATALGALTVAGSLAIASGAALTSGSYTHLLAGDFTNDGGSFTATGSTWTLNGSAPQTVSGANTFNNLTVNNSAGVTLAGSQTIAGDLTVSAGTMDLGAYTADGDSSGGTVLVASGATLRIGGTSTTFPSGYTTRTLGATSTVEYYGTTQTVLAQTYANLTVNQASGNATLGADATVNGILTLTAGNLAVTDPYILDMGAAATTVGTTDVTGIVRRQSISALTRYTFGSAFSAITWNTGDLPSSFSYKIAIGAAPAWKTSAILREYSFLSTWPGTPPTTTSTMTISMHYRDDELNGNAEANLVFFDCHTDEPGPTPTIPCTSSNIIDEHGKNSNDTTDNWVARSVDVETTYFGVAAWDTRPRTLGSQTTVANTWLGSASDSWTNTSNWSHSHVPHSTDDVVIPDEALTANDPILPASLEIKTLTLRPGAILIGSAGAALTVNGSTGAWVNEGGTFYPDTSTVTFTGAAAAISGTTDFYNLAVGSGAALIVGLNSVTRIAGALTNSGTFDVDELANTIEYNGGAQSVLAPNGATPGYWHLVLSGSGVKTMSASVIDIDGNLTLAGTASATAACALEIGGNLAIASGAALTSGSYAHLLAGNFTNDGGTFTATGSTWTLNGTSLQTVSGANTFNNLTVNNSAGVALGSSQTVAGTLTLTSGALTTNAYAIIANGSGGGSGGVVRTSGYVNGNLQKPVPTSGGSISRTYEVGTASGYAPVTVTFAAVSVAGTLAASSTAGQHANIATSLINPAKDVARYWTLASGGGLVFSSAASVFTFVSGDVIGSAATSAFMVNRYASGWSMEATGTKTSTSTEATGLTAFGDFAIGEVLGTIIYAPADINLGTGHRGETLTSDARKVEWLSSETGRRITVTMDGAGLSDGASPTPHTIAKANFSIWEPDPTDYTLKITPDGGPWDLKVITATTGTVTDSAWFKLQLLIPLDVAIGAYSGTLTFSVTGP